MTADVEAALVSDRLDRLEELFREHAELDRQMLAALARLVVLSERRDAREETALQVERERREASEESERVRTAAEIAERQAHGAWIRSVVGDRVAVPLGLVLAGGLGSVVTAIAGWVAQRLGGP